MSKKRVGSENAFDVLMGKTKHRRKNTEPLISLVDEDADDASGSCADDSLISSAKPDAFEALMSGAIRSQPSFPPGLTLKTDIISNPQKTLKQIMDVPRHRWKPVGSSSTSRRTLHFGYDYSYGAGVWISKTIPIPDFLIPLKSIAEEIIGGKTVFDQCLINEYLPGQGISRHVDKLYFGDTIACFSFGSSTVIQFRNPHDERIVDVNVPDNSLYIMQGDARYVWTHEMAARLKDGNRVRSTRYSVTFRQALEEFVVNL